MFALSQESFLILVFSCTWNVWPIMRLGWHLVILHNLDLFIFQWRKKETQHVNEGIRLGFFFFFFFFSFLIAWILNQILENDSIRKRLFVLQRDLWELLNIIAFFNKYLILKSHYFLTLLVDINLISDLRLLKPLSTFDWRSRRNNVYQKWHCQFPCVFYFSKFDLIMSF